MDERLHGRRRASNGHASAGVLRETVPRTGNSHEHPDVLRANEGGLPEGPMHLCTTIVQESTEVIANRTTRRLFEHRKGRKSRCPCTQTRAPCAAQNLNGAAKRARCGHGGTSTDGRKR